MSKKKKKNKRTPEQMAEIYCKQRLAMERNNKLREIDELENGDRREVDKFCKYLLGVNESNHPSNPTRTDQMIGLGQSPQPVNSNVHNYMKDFERKSKMKLIDVKGAFYAFSCEFGLVMLSDNHKKLNSPKSFIDEIGIKYGHTIGLEWIVANPKVRNVGWGNQVLEIITSLADEYDFDIVLHCCNGREFENTEDKLHDYDKFFGADTGSMDNSRLMQFYQKHGFEINPFHARIYLQDTNNKTQLELMMRPSTETKKVKFPTLFSKKIEGKNPEFTYENTLKNFKKLARVA